MSNSINNGRKLLDYSIGTAGTFSFDINKYGHNLYGIRIGLDGKPLSRQGTLPPGARKALKKLWEQILKAMLK